MANSLPTPATITAGTNPTAANFNTFRDSLQQLQGGTPTGGQGAFDFYSAVQATAQTGLTVSTYVAITFATTSEIVDVAGGHDPASNPSRYVGKMPGYYELDATVAFAGSASGARRLVEWRLNGGGGIAGSGGSAPPLSTNITTARTAKVFQYLNGTTDYVELYGFADYASWATAVSGASASCITVRWVHA